MTAARVLFIDRDGTLVEEPPDEQVDSLQKIRLLPGVIPALLELKRAGYRFVLVSNQDGLGSETFPEPAFREPQDFLRRLFASQGIEFDAEFFCPHRPADGCECRKPRTGLLDAYLREHPIDPRHSYVIGDRETDLQLAANLGLAGPAGTGGRRRRRHVAGHRRKPPQPGARRNRRAHDEGDGRPRAREPRSRRPGGHCHGYRLL